MGLIKHNLKPDFYGWKTIVSDMWWMIFFSSFFIIFCRRVGAGSGDPLAACSIIKKRVERKPIALSNLRKAAADHQKFVKGTTMYPLEHSLGHGALCTVPANRITQSWLLICDLVYFHVSNWTKKWLLTLYYSVYEKHLSKGMKIFHAPTFFIKVLIFPRVRWQLEVENTFAFLLIPVVSNQKYAYQMVWRQERTISCNSYYIQCWRKKKVKKEKERKEFVNCIRLHFFFCNLIVDELSTYLPE